ISFPLPGSLPAKTRASLIPAHAHGHHLRPSTNCYKLSETVLLRTAFSSDALFTAPFRAWLCYQRRLTLAGTEDVSTSGSYERSSSLFTRRTACLQACVDVRETWGG